MIFKLIFHIFMIISLVFQLKCDSVEDQLNSLDKTMIKELDLKNEEETTEEQCVEPQLGYCKDVVKYPISKAQSIMHSFYEGLIKSAMDGLVLETRGSILSCKQDVKRLLCKDRFPSCAHAQLDWQNGPEKCGEIVEKCPQDVRDKLMQFGFCNKLNKGSKNINECISPLILGDMKYCIPDKNENVSPWNYHSAVEVNGLLEIQTSLWNSSKKCINGLSKYLCSPAKACFDGKEAAKMLTQYKKSCKEAINSCSNEVVSTAVKDIFLNCA